MISAAILQEIRMDIAHGPDQDEWGVGVDEAEAFWLWFNENAATFITGEIPATQINGHFLIGDCFHNARCWAQQTNESYAEGFMKVQGHFILHGFNLAQGQAIDITVQTSPGEFQDHLGRVPEHYYGVIIPPDFIAGHVPHTGSLLCAYFRSLVS